MQEKILVYIDFVTVYGFRDPLIILGKACSLWKKEIVGVHIVERPSSDVGEFNEQMWNKRFLIC